MSAKDENWPQLGPNKAIVKITRARYEQARACVSACAGMSDHPAKEIQSMREALKEIASKVCWSHSVNELGKDCTEFTEWTPVMYCATCLARHTLKNL